MVRVVTWHHCCELVRMYGILKLKNYNLELVTLNCQNGIIYSMKTTVPT